MAGSRNTRAEAGDGLVATVAIPAVRVTRLSVRKERRSLLLFSIERAEEEAGDLHVTGMLVLEKAWLSEAE